MINFLDKADHTKLNETDIRILTYIQEHLAIVARMTINELANRLYTSRTVIIRACQKIGLSGFSELKFLIKEELVHEKKRQSSLKELVDQQINDFSFYLETISFSTIESIVKLLCSEYSLYIHGQGLSAIPARYMHTILNTLNRRCILIDDVSLMNSISHTIQPNSIIFLISDNDSLDIYQDVFKNSQQNQAIVILIAPRKKCNPENLVNYYLFCDENPLFYNNVDVTPRTNTLVLIQLIIEGVSQKMLEDHLL